MMQLLFRWPKHALEKQQTYQKVVAITLGTGFGSSFLINGQPIFDGNFIPKGGFLYNQKYNGDLADAIFSTRGVVASYENKTGKTVKNVRELCSLIPEDTLALNVLQQFGTQLGTFLNPYLNKFEADVLVIGGNISKAYPNFSEQLKREIPNIEVYVSNSGEKAAVIGGALLIG